MAEAIRSHLIRSAAKDEPRKVEDCPKVRIDQRLLQVDCSPCPERNFCSIRANTVYGRSQALMPRVVYVEQLYAWGTVLSFGLRDLQASEVRDLVVYRQVLNDVKNRLESEQVSKGT